MPFTHTSTFIVAEYSGLFLSVHNTLDAAVAAAEDRADDIDNSYALVLQGVKIQEV